MDGAFYGLTSIENMYVTRIAIYTVLINAHTCTILTVFSAFMALTVQERYSRL